MGTVSEFTGPVLLLLGLASHAAHMAVIAQADSLVIQPAINKQKPIVVFGSDWFIW
jgi:hypothetical protein